MTEIIDADMRALGWRVNDLTSKDWDEYEPPELEEKSMSNKFGLFEKGQAWILTDTVESVEP